MTDMTIYMGDDGGRQFIAERVWSDIEKELGVALSSANKAENRRALERAKLRFLAGFKGCTGQAYAQGFNDKTEDKAFGEGGARAEAGA